MKTLGIVGGIGPESTVEYYRLIVSSYLDRNTEGNYPQVIINSINMKKMLDLIGANKRDDVTAYLVGELDRLAKAGANVALLASNTPHIVFEGIQKASPIPLISIVEAACDKVRDMGMKRVGLFGTRFTMQGGFYDDIFETQGISIVCPEKKDQDYIHEKYMNELIKGVIRDKTKNDLLNIARDLRQSRGIEGLILGGTELPLIIKESDNIGIPILDTTRIHVDRALQMLV